MKLHNTLGRQIQEFTPLQPHRAKIYTCGPTVYDYQHIGNYFGYIYLPKPQILSHSNLIW
jgi:cysteinyl-tRNA synthetase